MNGVEFASNFFRIAERAKRFVFGVGRIFDRRFFRMTGEVIGNLIGDVVAQSFRAAQVRSHA